MTKTLDIASINAGIADAEKFLAQARKALVNGDSTTALVRLRHAIADLQSAADEINLFM